MHERLPTPLVPTLIDIASKEYGEIRGWPFVDLFVGRMLLDDIPQRVQYGYGRVWGYRDDRGVLVGVGTLDFCREYPAYSANRFHPYLPLLAVHPFHQRRGHGGSILRHLIAEATFMAVQFACQDILYLDVYADSLDAIGLYKKGGFVHLITEPMADPEEGGRGFLVMSRRVAVAEG